MLKYIFIVGLPRSGSTLWQNVLSMNKNVFRLSEMHFLNPFRNDFQSFLKYYNISLLNDKDCDRMIDLIFSGPVPNKLDSPFWRFENIEKARDKNTITRIRNRIKSNKRSLEAVFKSILEELLESSDYSICCLKFPVYPNHIGLLSKWYPDSRIVHITRDPRAMAISRTNDPGGTAKKLQDHPNLGKLIKYFMILFVIMQYILTSLIHLKYRHKNNYALFKYEDLLIDPSATIKQLCQFAQIDFVPDMLNPNKGQASSITGLKYNKINPQAGSKWQSVISPFQLIITNIFTYISMRIFKYNPRKHPIYRI